MQAREGWGDWFLRCYASLQGIHSSEPVGMSWLHPNTPQVFIYFNLIGSKSYHWSGPCCKNLIWINSFGKRNWFNDSMPNRHWQQIPIRILHASSHLDHTHKHLRLGATIPLLHWALHDISMAAADPPMAGFGGGDWCNRHSHPGAGKDTHWCTRSRVWTELMPVPGVQYGFGMMIRLISECASL